MRAFEMEDYTPSELPWWTTSEIGEIRRFSECHHRFEALMREEGSNEKKFRPEMEKIQDLPIWPSYEQAVSDFNADRKRK